MANARSDVIGLPQEEGEFGLTEVYFHDPLRSGTSVFGSSVVEVMVGLRPCAWLMPVWRSVSHYTLNDSRVNQALQQILLCCAREFAFGSGIP